MSNNATAEANNILQFPTNRIVNPLNTALHSDTIPNTIPEVKDIIQQNKVKKVNQIMEALVPIIANGLVSTGINIADRKTMKHSAMFIESLRSLIYQHIGMDHPIQTLADTIIEISEDGHITVNKVKVKEKEESEKS